MRARDLVVMLTMLTACGGQEEAPEPAADGAAVEEMEGGGGMSEMGGMGSMQADGGTMDPMEMHLRQVEGVGGEQMREMLPQHRQMVANMIARMNREMREMDMAADSRWDATVDSLRQDLVRLPEMDAAELEALMPAHRARVRRLMEMHHEMMAEMGM